MRSRSVRPLILVVTPDSAAVAHCGSVLAGNGFAVAPCLRIHDAFHKIARCSLSALLLGPGLDFSETLSLIWAAHKAHLPIVSLHQPIHLHDVADSFARRSFSPPVLVNAVNSAAQISATHL